MNRATPKAASGSTGMGPADPSVIALPLTSDSSLINDDDILFSEYRCANGLVTWAIHGYTFNVAIRNG